MELKAEQRECHCGGIMFLLMLSNGHNNCKLPGTGLAAWPGHLDEQSQSRASVQPTGGKQFHYPGGEKRNLFYGFLVKRRVSVVSSPVPQFPVHSSTQSHSVRLGFCLFLFLSLLLTRCSF